MINSFNKKDDKINQKLTLFCINFIKQTKRKNGRRKDRILRATNEIHKERTKFNKRNVKRGQKFISAPSLKD